VRAGVVQATWADWWGREVGLLRIFQPVMLLCCSFFYFSFHILDIVYIQIFLLKIMGIQLNTLDT